MASTPVDWFALAVQRSESLPASLAIRQRLARLQAELVQAGVAAEDPAVPKMIAALFPPGVLAPPAGTVPPPGAPPPEPAWPAPAGVGHPAERPAWWRGYRGKRGLLLRFLAPLLCLTLAADALPVDPPTEPDQAEAPVAELPGNVKWVPQPPIEVEQPNPRFYRSLAGFVVGGAALWLLLLYLLQQQRRRMKRDANPDVDPVIDLALRVGRANLFAGPGFDSALKQLRLRRAAPSQRLDVRKSLRATIARAGLPELHFGERRHRPDYLILSDREMPGDHLPEIGRALRERLAGAQLETRHYEFTGAPWRLRLDHPGERGGFEAADAVMARHPDARVLISAEGFELADELARAKGWAEAFGSEHCPILLNPRGAAHWHAPENRLAAAGMTVVAAERMDPRAIARAYAEDGPPGRQARHDNAEEADLPAFLAEDRELLLSHTRPADDEVAAVAANLEVWLDADEMRWLRTLALFPVIHPALTYFAGLAEFKTDAVPLGRYLKLVRLPWFRAGAMPDWLRQVLVTGMEPAAFEQAKRVLQAFFSREAASARGAADILVLCARAGRARSRRRFAQGIRRSDIPALKDGLVQSAFLHEDPAEVGFLSEVPPARDLPKWLESGLLLAICAAGVLLFSESRTRVVKVPQPPVRQENPAPTPSPTPTATPSPIPTSTPTDGLGSRIVYAQIAVEEDREAARRFLAALSGTPVFKKNGLTVAGIELREDDSPASTEVRCFSAASCAVAADVRGSLGKLGIAATVSNLGPSKYGGAARPLEIWFADKDLIPEPFVSCDPGPYVVYFEWDKYTLTPEAQSRLDQALSKYLRACSSYTVDITAHTDSERSAADALQLTAREAEEVRAYLVSKGIPNSRIETRAAGSTNPMVPTAVGVREPLNRRAEITFQPPSDAKAR